MTLDEFRAKVGEEVGLSDWVVIDQARIDAFAETTEDRQFIHVDPARAAETPFGGTIAHGFLSLSLLAGMADRANPKVDGLEMTVNYGLDKVRFLAPVPVGSRLRGRFTLTSVEPREDEGQFLCRYYSIVEIEGAEKPALIAEQLMLVVVV